MKKIKIFLGAYINSINAQNLNCRSLTEHLDKKRFEIYTLTLFSGELDTPHIEGVKYFNCFRPHKISKYIGYLWGIINCDIAYLPKGEICRWNKFWVKLLRKKSFKTVEGIYGDDMMKQFSDSGIDYGKFLESKEGYDKVYSITDFLRKYNYRRHGMESEKRILYLGTDTECFLNEQEKTGKLENIIFIGRLKERKGVFDFLHIAETFPQLNFFMAGEGEDRDRIEKLIRERGMNNVTLLGSLTHEKLADILKTMDLHLFPSRSEGFPKVTLETAAAGVPSLVYSDYGAEEWITDHENGFVVDTLDEMENTVRELADNPELLKKTSKNAVELAKRFDWKVVIKDWENVIEELYQR
ncbi:glycosyltransferase family 4 protein [Hydrogenimonas sp. SS33]|uniref:glycosyltransferase family 4 protein n=1 Tax=Hydrogenimonas leucolamina TaxID=2954236 RepID=UPI00336BFE1F